MASIFTKIVNKEIPAHIVAETRDFLAFLDIKPVQKGHVLVIPKKETDYLFDLDDETYIGLQLFAKAVALALLKAVPAQRIATAAVGLEVPHAHIHLIPINQISDMSFDKERLNMTDGELAFLAATIRASF